MAKGILYMLPCTLGGTAPEQVLPGHNFEVMRRLDYFIVENTRSARRFLSASRIGRPIDELTFFEINEHTTPHDVEKAVVPLLTGRSAGMISEAGLPGVADPGAEVVAACHRKGVDVVPLTGPSSIMLALMGSGMNGQSFAFNGYLPVKPQERAKAIRFFERRANTERQTQIFIETPYRNGKLFEEFLGSCSPQTMLCVAADLTLETEFIRSKSISEWRKSPAPELHKRPAIFLML